MSAPQASTSKETLSIIGLLVAALGIYFWYDWISASTVADFILDWHNWGWYVMLLILPFIGILLFIWGATAAAGYREDYIKEFVATLKKKNPNLPELDLSASAARIIGLILGLIALGWTAFCLYSLSGYFMSDPTVVVGSSWEMYVYLVLPYLVGVALLTYGLQLHLPAVKDYYESLTSQLSDSQKKSLMENVKKSFRFK